MAELFVALSVVCTRGGLVLSRPIAPMVAKNDPTHISMSRAVDMSVMLVPHAQVSLDYKMGRPGFSLALARD